MENAVRRTFTTAAGTSATGGYLIELAARIGVEDAPQLDLLITRRFRCRNHPKVGAAP